MQNAAAKPRRILALWFPRLGAERAIRRARGAVAGPLAVVRESGNMQVLASLSEEASLAGLSAGQPLRDALAMCPELLTEKENVPAEEAFLGHLRRWAGKFSPWVSGASPGGLFVDLTGASHLFGGEEGVADLVEADCARFGLTVQLGIADTPGAAWALARFAGQGVGAARSGDAIDQEAYATRSRAVKRRNWERGGAAPKVVALRARQARIAAPGQTRQALATLPVAALRLPEDVVTELGRVGLRRVEDLLNQPRAPLVRRYGAVLGQRIDQALGLLAEPISPARPPRIFACRMSLPEPIGLEEDVAAALDRMLPTLADRLAKAGRGARRLRLEAHRADGTAQAVEVGLARPSALADRMRPLLAMKLPEIDAGFGIDMLRLSAPAHEAVRPEQHRRLPGEAPPEAVSEIDDLIGRLGARIGLEAVTRRAPGASHIPEKAAQTLAAAFSEPATDWPREQPPRPLTLFDVELVDVPDTPDAPHLPARFKWRGRWFETARARGPERIAPEWWLDERPWRTGTRDYWQVMTREGERLWLYYAHGGTQTGGWFCHGQFA
ncbi:MAG: DNA polymerase Y family protein [Pseudomonadota bacterium]